MCWRSALRAAALGVAIAGVLVSAAPPATGATAGGNSWRTIKKTLQAAFDPASTNPCNRGSLSCLTALVNEMDRRFDPLASSCDHDAVFSLAYLRTTQKIQQTVTADPAFFHNNAFVNHEAAYFASYYFNARDAFLAGKLSKVPPAWRIAFQASRDRTVNGSGDLLLQASAHINRDLPFVLDAMGLTEPGGYSLYQDHKRVDDILRQVVEPLFAEETRRFDPSVGTTEFEGTTLDDEAYFRTLSSWRETAWDNAVRLANAQTPAQWQTVAHTIEAQAAAEAQSIVESETYVPPLTTTQARDAYCATHWNS